MKLGVQVGLGPGRIVLNGDPAPTSQRGTAPQFSAYICCGQMAGWVKILLGVEVALGPSDFVLDGDPAPLPKRGQSPPPQFSAHVYCGQTAGWINTALGTEVGLGPGHIVLDENPAPFPKNGGRAHSQIFGPSLLWPNGWMHQDATWYRSMPQPRRFCVRWGTQPPSQKGGTAPNFGPMSVAAKRNGGRPQPRRLCVRWGPNPPHRQWGGAPAPFSAHVCCGQVPAWVKMPLDTEVSLGQDNTVLDGDPAPPP